jgi:hypothetical protein
MSIAAPTNHVLRIADLDPERLEELLDLVGRTPSRRSSTRSSPRAGRAER